MMASNDPTNSEVTLGADGIKLKGAIIDTISKSKACDTLVSTIDSLLGLIDNVVGLPADYISTHLQPFRQSLKHELNRIDIEKQQFPDFRIACKILRDLSFSATEPELQSMYAKLFSTACNSNKVEIIRPSFASILLELSQREIQIIRLIYDTHVEEFGCDNPELFHTILIHTDVIFGKIHFKLADNKFDVYNNMHADIDSLVRMGIFERCTILKENDGLCATHLGGLFIDACLPSY